jgi:LacI family transcriptional regulator
MELKELGRQAGLAIHRLCNGEPVEPGVTRIPCSLVLRSSS